MPFQEAYSAIDSKKINLVPNKTEVGTKEDLGTNVSWELAKSFQTIEEKSDAGSKEAQPEKSVAEIQADIRSFREKIKIGENSNNERMVLENEAKLREVENKISAISNPEKLPTTDTEQSVAPTNKTAEKPIKKKGFFSKLFGFGGK